MNKTKIDYSYIAGFFDGEGSAMILTVKRKEENNIFRFRPVIKIAQATTPILHKIRKLLGFGKVVGNKISYVGKQRTTCYQVNGSKNILKFIELVSPYVVLKKKQLLLLKDLIKLQYKKNKPYTKKEFKKMIDIRDKVHKLNCKTRKNSSLKYSKNEILKIHNFVNIKEWEKRRYQKGMKALIKYQKNR